MSATSFRRMRRTQALQAQLDEQGIDYSEFAGDEAALREALVPKEEQKTDDDEQIIEAALRAKAKGLGIKSYHLKSIETLTNEIAEKEKGGG